MSKKIQFEWELPDTLVDALAPDLTEVADTIKAAAVLDWVRIHKLSLRRGPSFCKCPIVPSWS
jgi:hypothetical protein